MSEKIYLPQFGATDNCFNPTHTPVTPAIPTLNRPQTDRHHQIWREIGVQSICRSVPVYVRTDTYSGRDISNIFERFFFLQIVGCLSVWCRFCRGAFGDVSFLIRPPMVDGLSGLDRLCMDIYRPTSQRFKADSSRIKSRQLPNCMESACSFQNQNRVPDKSRTKNRV